MSETSAAALNLPSLSKENELHEGGKNKTHFPTIPTHFSLVYPSFFPTNPTISFSRNTSTAASSNKIVPFSTFAAFSGLDDEARWRLSFETQRATEAASASGTEAERRREEARLAWMV
jgi:hypothetical protein